MYKKILILAIPIIFGNILQMISQIINMFWIGRYSEEAIAAISISSFVIFLFMSIGIGISIAGTILAAQSFGKKDYKELNNIAGQSMSIIFIASIIITILGVLLSKWIIRLMGADPTVEQQAISYISIFFMCIFFVFGSMIIQSVLRGVGEVKAPVYITLITVTLNFIIDPLLIYGYGFVPKMGVVGAGIATMISQIITFICLVIILYRKGKYNIYFHKENFKITKDFLKKFLKLGLPSSLEMGARSLGGLLLVSIVAGLGTHITAAYGVGNQIWSMVLFIGLGFSVATTTLAGQFYGAGDHHKLTELRHKSMYLSFFTLTTIGVLIFIFAEILLKIFIPDSIKAIAEGISFLRTISLFLGLVGTQLIIVAMFRGIGETSIPMFLTIIGLWGIQLPIAHYGVKYNFGSDAIWYSFVISWIVMFVISFIWYKTPRWKKEFF